MNLTRDQRNELNALSKEVFGVSSRWKKLVDKGEVEPITEERTSMVQVGDEPETAQTIKVPLKRKDGALRLTATKHTVESVKELMLSYKAKREEQIALFRKNMEEQAAKKSQEEAQAKVNTIVGSSA